MSEKASIKVERRSTFDFDKDEEEENFNQWKGQIRGGEYFFALGLSAGFRERTRGKTNGVL